MKAFIKNNINGKEYVIQKDSLEELNSFIEYQKNKKKCPWGSLERTVEVLPSEYPDNAVLIEAVVRGIPKFEEDGYTPVTQQGPQSTDEFGELLEDEFGNPVYSQEQVFEDVTMHVVSIPQEFTVTVDEVPEDKSEEYLLALRMEIESILDKTDWLFISDVVIPVKYRNIYKDYRQVLRDAHGKETFQYTTESSYTFESFENYVRRTKPEEFLDGGDGESIVKKFNSKIR